ncbi:MAG: cobalamin-binding protein [Thermoleophilia bacterium]|nr:cobalamin-binding protein [Thermoleophilia bacterium]
MRGGARRIVSLVPGVTEMLVALGLGGRLVGRSHECDHPPEVAGVPVVTEDLLGPLGDDQGAIDRAVAEAAAEGRPLARVLDEVLAGLAPDLIVTQSLCEVCAVARPEAERAAAALPGRPDVLSLAPRTLAGVLDAMAVLAATAGVDGRPVVDAMRVRLAAVRRAVAGRPVPGVACLEWLDPPYGAGHWVPDQVAAAGGVDLLAASGSRSRALEWAEVVAGAPEVVVLMPCGLDAPAALAAAGSSGAAARLAGTPAAAAGRVVAVDGSGCFSRPGPRLVDGVEALAAVLHPGAVPPAPAGRVLPVPVDAAPVA